MKPGRPKELDVQKYRYAWAVLKIIGNWTLKQIAKTFQARLTTVEMGINLFLQALPKEDLVAERFRPIISLLRDPESQRNKEKYWYARGFVNPMFRLPARQNRRSPAVQPQKAN
jgi:hypothetical protein